MPTANQILVAALTTAQKILNRYTDDLTPQEWLRRPCEGGNAVAWIVGHLVITERSSLAKAGLKPDQLPRLPEGFEKRFGREPEAPKAADFGDTTILMPLFNQHRQLLIDTVKNLPPAALDQPLEKPHPMIGTTAGEAITFLGATHTSMHAGQITIIRRTMGKPPLV
jgi:DinB superfamily